MVVFTLEELTGGIGHTYVSLVSNNFTVNAYFNRAEIFQTKFGGDLLILRLKSSNIFFKNGGACIAVLFLDYSY